MIKAHIIGSGSKGNATIIYSDKTTILVDFGVTIARLKEGLSEISKTIDDIDFAFFTHDHNDHIRNYEAIDASKRYALEKTIPLLKSNILSNYKKYTFNDFEVMPIKASHDALNPCGYVFVNGDEKIVYLTDTGKIYEKTLKAIFNATYYIIESNYDQTLLENSGRPYPLIRRIFGQKGHLSNEESAYYMSYVIGDKTKKIALAHISEECNKSEIALKTHQEIYNKMGVSMKDIELVCAKQWESIDL